MSRESPTINQHPGSIVLVMVDQLSARWVEACLAGAAPLPNLAHDPDEQRNLARDPAYDGTRHDMRDRLLELLIEQDYPHSPRGRFAYGAP